MTLIMKATEFDKQAAAFKRQFTNEQALRDAGWLLQPKYDGCFGMAVLRPNGDSRMLSRTGEDYSASCGHILEELDRVVLPSLEAAEDGAVVLGEVWHNEWPFPVISGSMRRRAPCPELRFAAHDLLPIELETPVPYLHRLVQLESLSFKFREPVVVTHVSDADDPLIYAYDLQAAGGYDGAMLKDPHVGYKIGNVRFGQIVKVKPTKTLDLRVVSRLVQAGAKTGRDVFTIGVEYKGAITQVGSGMPHDPADVPQIGQIVEVAYLGVTEEGRLREPRFIGIRHDKATPDA
jgi:DNA ligase-1